jgi:excisionase family DNA binding protein
MEKLLSLEEAGQLLGVSPMTIKRWAKEGLVTIVYLPKGNRPRITKSEIDRLISPGEKSNE